ncbi:MAG: tetratricopeptide repeat protein [Planctomycetaceae bacterium]
MTSRALVIGMVFLAGGMSGQLPAADRVTIRPADSSGLVVLTGEIQDYNDEFLTLRAGSSPATTYPSDSVAAVETFRPPAELQGIEFYQQGHITEAITQFETALKLEPRRWVQHELLAWLVRCHQRQGNLEAAATRFVEIVADEPHTRHWNVAPLGWMPQTIPDRLQAAARRWLAAEQEAVRLVGASIALSSTATRLSGVAELRKLSRGQDRYISSLAQSLQQGATLDSSVTTGEQMYQWRREIERIPESIRGGPWYAFGQAHMHRSEPEEAAAAFLRVLLVHPGDEQLTARAGVEAGLALQRLNRKSEADVAFQEVIERFAWTTSAQEALRQLATPDGRRP